MLSCTGKCHCFTAPLLSLSLALWPGPTLCTDQQQQPAACTWCHLDPAPHRTTSTSPDSSRTTDL